MLSQTNFNILLTFPALADRFIEPPLIHFPPGMEFLSGTQAKHQEGISNAQLFKVIVSIWQQIVSRPFD